MGGGVAIGGAVVEDGDGATVGTGTLSGPQVGNARQTTEETNNITINPLCFMMCIAP